MDTKNPHDAHAEGRAPAADWSHWAHMSKVELWQAVALSMDRQPPTALDGLGRQLDQRFNNRARVLLGSEFSVRLSIALSHLEPRDGRKAGALHVVASLAAGRRAMVDLREFAAWTQGLRRPGWLLPEQFPMAAETTASAPAEVNWDSPPADTQADKPGPLTGAAMNCAASPAELRKQRRDKLPSDAVNKRGELLRMFRELGGKLPSESGKKGTWGAMSALERNSGIDSRNLGSMLKKAIEEKTSRDQWDQLNRH